MKKIALALVVLLLGSAAGLEAYYLTTHWRAKSPAVTIVPSAPLPEIPVEPEARPQVVDTIHPGLTSKDIPKAANSMDAAAIAVFTFIYAHSHAYEYAGVILKDYPGKYIASEPRTFYHGMDSAEDLNADHFPNSLIVAGYHTHPCLQDAYSYAFSAQDIYSSRQDNIPEYLLDMCTGKVHYWAPGDALDPPVFGESEILATGKIIGQIKVDGKVLQ